MNRATGRVLAAVVVITSVVVIMSSAASAHAVVVSSNPSDGQVVSVAPSEVVIRFSESVSADLGGLTVLDERGDRVDRGDASRGATNDVLRVGLKSGLSDGTYVANYRVVSADGHPVTGAILFGVGPGTSINDTALLGLQAQTDRTYEIAGAVFRFITYVAALLAAGLAGFVAFLHDQRSDRWKLTPIVRIAALVAAFGALGTIIVQAALATGRGLAAAGDLVVLRKVLTESLGWSTVVLLVGLALVHLSTDTSRLLVAQMLSFYGGLALTASFVLWGHTTQSDHRWVAIITDFVHVTAAAVWFGGLVGLATTLALRARERRTGAQDAGGDIALVRSTARIVKRFSTVAALSVIALLVAGVGLAWTQMASLSSLGSTTYGRLLLAKILVVLVILGIAAYNRFNLVPDVIPSVVSDDEGVEGSPDGEPNHDDPDDDSPDDHPGHDGGDNQPSDEAMWRRLLSTVRLEAIGIVAVLAITSVLVNVTPARTLSSTPSVFNQSAPMSRGGEVNLVITPNRVGTNTLHIQYYDDSGRPVGDVTQLQVEFLYTDKGIGPIVRDASRGGAGHFIYEGSELSIPGTWQVTLVARLSEFDQERTSFDVDVAR